MRLENFSGKWKLLRGESEFGYLPAPRFRVDDITHGDSQIRIITHQIDLNGDNTVERSLTIGGEPVEIAILGRARFVSASWDDKELVIATRSTVSGNERLLEDRWSIDEARTGVTVTRVHHLPGGAVRQVLRFRPVA